MNPGTESIVCVVSWNLLAQKFVSNRLEWSTRRACILDTLSGVHADVILLQEAGMDTFEADFQELVHPIDGLYDYTRYQSKKKRRHRQCCVILWRRATFSLCSSSTASHRATHCVLMHGATGRRLAIANLHLKAGLVSNEEVRVKELEDALLCCEESDCLLLGGDLNDDLKPAGRLYPILHETVRLEGIDSAQPSCFINGTYMAFDHLLTHSGGGGGGGTLTRLHCDTPYTNTSPPMNPRYPIQSFPLII